MKVVFIGEIIRTPDAPDHQGIVQGIQQMKWEYLILDPILERPDDIVRKCNEFNPDLVIHGNTDSLVLGIIPKIRARQVFFMGDYRPSKEQYQQWDTWVHNSRGLSAIFISNYDQIDMWKEAFNIPVFFWPHGCYVLDKPIYDKRFEHDMVFIGQMNNTAPYNERREFILALNEEIKKQLKTEITFYNGDGTEGRNSVWRDMPAIYHSAKVVLDISHFWNVEGYASGRYWYSSGLGGCALTKRFPRCEEFYPTGTKVYFDSIPECIEKLNDLLSNKFLRISIKSAAFEHNKMYHSYKKRFQKMILFMIPIVKGV